MPGGNITLIPDENGWVDRAQPCNDVGVQGDWFSFSDQTSNAEVVADCTTLGGHQPSECAQISFPEPGTVFPNVNGAMHTWGTVEQILPCVSPVVTTLCPNPDHDYTNMWGALIGFNFNADPPPLDDDWKKTLWDAAAYDVIGIEFTIDVVPSGLRVQFDTVLTDEEGTSANPPLPPGSAATDLLGVGASYWGAQFNGDGRWPPSPVTVGRNRILWSEVLPPVLGHYAFDPRRLLSVYFMVPTSSNAPANYDFTISQLTFLRQ